MGLVEYLAIRQFQQRSFPRLSRVLVFAKLVRWDLSSKDELIRIGRNAIVPKQRQQRASTESKRDPSLARSAATKTFCKRDHLDQRRFLWNGSSLGTNV